jgi:hypothetical protein
MVATNCEVVEIGGNGAFDEVIEAFTDGSVCDIVVVDAIGVAEAVAVAVGLAVTGNTAEGEWEHALKVMDGLTAEACPTPPGSCEWRSENGVDVVVVNVGDVAIAVAVAVVVAVIGITARGE